MADPDKMLSELREHLNADDMGLDDGFDGTRALFIEFDKWLSAGGFLPSAWVPEMGREAKTYDENDHCFDCGEHLSYPHSPVCRRETKR